MNRGRGGGNFRPTFRGGVTGRGGAFSAARQPMRGSPQFIGGGNSNSGFQGNQHGNQFQGRPQVNPRDSGFNSVSADSNRGGCRPGCRAFQQGNMFTDKRSGSPVEMQRQGNQDMNQLNERFGRQSLNESGQGDYVLVERRGRAGHIQRGLVRVTDRGAMGQGFGGSRGRGFVKPRNISSGSPTARRLATSRGSSSSPNLGRGFARQQDCDSPSSWYKSRNRSNSPSFRQGRGHIKPRDNSSSPNYIYRRDFPGPKEVGMPRPRTDSKDRDKLINKVPKEKKQQASWIPLEENEKKLEETESRPEKQKSSPEKQKSSPEKQKPSPEKLKTSPQKVQLSLENKDLNKDCSSVEEVLSLSLFTVSEDATSGKVVESSLHEKFGDLKDTTNRGACSDKGEGDRNNNSRTASGNKRSWLETASGERSKQRTLSGERKGRHNKASGKRQGRIGTVSGKSSRHETVSGERSRRETVSGESRSRHGISFGEKSRPKQSRREVSNQKKTISQDIFQDKLHSNMPVFNRRQNVQEGIRHIGHISRRDAALYTNPRKLVRSHSDESEYCFERSEMVFDRRLSPDFERLDTHSGRSYEDISSPDHRHWRHVSNDTRSSSNERNRKFESLSPSKYSHARSLSREHRSNSGERRFESSFSRFKEYHTDKLRLERSNSFERRREEANSELKNDDFKRFSRNGRSSSGERSRESFSSFKKHNPSSISRSSSGEAKNREESISSFEKYYPRNLSRETSSEKRMEDLSFQKYDPSSRSGSVERRKVTASVTAFQKYLSKSLKSDEKRPQKAFFTRSNSKKRRPHGRLAFNKEHSECLTSPKDDARFENSGSGQKKDHGSISLERCGDDRAHYSSEEYHNYNRMEGTYERNYDLDASEIFISSDSDASAVQSFGQKKKETDPDFSRSRKRVSGREMFDTERPFENIDSEDTYHLYRLKDNPESYQFGGDHVGHGPDQRGDLYDPCHPLETESDQREEIFDYFQRERCQDGPKENTFVKERKSLFNESMSDISSDSKLGEDDEGSEDAFCVSVSQKTHESVLVHLDHKNSENCDEGDKEDFLQLKDKQENRKSNWKEVQSASKEGSSGPFLAKTTKKSKSGTESQSQDHANGENPFEEKPEKLPKESSRKENFVSSCLKEGYSTYAYEDDSSSSDEIESVKATKPKIYIDFRKAPIRRFSKDKTDFTRKSLDDTECQQFKFADKVKPQDVFEVQNIAELDSNDGTSSIGDIHELLEKSYKEKSSILKDKVAKDVRPSPLCVDMDRDSSGTDVQILPMDKMRNLSNERQRVVESSGSSDSESSSESSPKFTRIREKRLSSGNRCSRKKSSSSFTSASSSSSSSSGSSSSSSSRSRSRSPKGSRTLRSFSTTRKRPPQGSKTLSSCTRSRSPRGFRTQRSYSRSRQRYPRGSKTQRFSTRTKKRYPEGPMSSKITSRQKTITSDSNSSSSDVTYDSSDSLSKNYSSTSRSSYEKKKSRPRKWKPWCHFGYGRNAFSPSVRPGRGQERRSVSVARSKLNFYDKFRFKCKQWIRAQEPEIKAAERRLIKEIVTEDAVTKDTSSLSKESSSELVVATQNLKISEMGETTTMELDSVQLKLQTHSTTDMKLDKSAEKALKGNKIEKQRSLSKKNSEFDTKVSNEITDNSKELKPIKALAFQESEAGDVAFTGKKDIDCSKKTEISLSQSQNLSVKSKEESSLHSPVHKTGGAKVSPIQRKLMMGVKLAKSTSPKKSFWNDKQKRRYTKSFVFSPTKKQTPKEKPPDPGSHRKLVFDDTSSPEKSSQKQNEQAVKQQISSETHDNLSSLTGDQALWTLKGKEEIKEISLNLSDIPLPETPIKKAVCVEDARAVAEDSTKATASFRKREVSKETTSDHEEVDMDLDEEDSLGLEEDTTWFEPKVANNLGTSEAAMTSSAVQEACSTDTSQYPADLCSYWSSQGYMNPGCPMGYPQHNYWSSGQSMQYYYDPYYTYQYSGNSQYSVGQSCGSVCSADEPPIPGNQETSKPPSLSEVQGTTVLPPLPKDQGNTVAPPLPDDQGTTVPQPLPEDQGTAIPKPLPEDQGSMVSPRMPEDQVTTQLPSFIRGYGISVPPPNEIGITSPRHSPEKHASAKPVLLLKDNGTKQPEHEHEIGKYPSMPEYQGTTQLPYVQEEHHTDKPKAHLEDCLSLLQKNLKKISENQQSMLLKKFRSKSQLTHEEPLTLSNYDPKCKNVAIEPEILICNDASVKSLDPQPPHVRSPNQVIVSSETGDKYLQQKSTSSKPRQLSGQSQTVSPEKLIASLQVLIQAAPVKIPSQAQALSTQAPRISSQSHSVYSQSLSIHHQSSLKPPLPVPSVTPPVHPASIVPDSVHVPVPVPPPRQLSSPEHQNTSHLFQSLLTSLIPPIDEIQTPKPVPPPRDFKCASSPFTSLPKTLPNPCAISSDQPSTYATAETRSMKSLEPKLMPKQKMTPSTDQPSAFVLKNSQAEGKQASALSNFSNLASKESELHRKTTTEMSSDLVSTVKIPKSPSTVSKDPRLRKSFEQNKAFPKGPRPGDGQSSSKDSQQGGSKTSVQLKQLSYSLQPKKRSRNLGAHSKYLKQLKSVLTSSLAKSKSSKESFPKRERYEMSQSSDTKRTPFVAPLPNFALTKVHSQKNPSALADSDYSDCPIETECQPSRTFSSLPKYCKQRSDGPNVCPQNIMRQEGNDAPKISYHPNHDNVDQQPFYVNQYRPSNYSTKDQQNDTNSALRSTYPNPEQRTVTIPNRQSNTKPDLQPTYSNPCSTRPSAVLNDPIRDLQTNCSSPFPTRPSAQQAYPKQDTARPSAQCLNQPNNNKNPDHQPYYQDQEIPPNYTNPDQSACSTNQPITGQPCYPNQHPAHILSPSLLSSSASNPSNPINKQSRDPRLQAQAKQQDKTRIAIKTLFKTVSRSQSSTPPEKHETKSSRSSRGATILVPGVTKTPESVKSYGGKNTSGILKPVNLQEVYERDGNSGAKTAEVDNGSSNISDGYWKGLGENNEAQGSSQSSTFPSLPAAARTAADVSKTLQTGGVHKPSPATLISPFKLSPSSAFAATASTASLKSQLTPETESSGTRPSAAPALSSAKTVSLAAASQRPTPDAAVLKAEDQNFGENISLSTVNTIPLSARRSNSKVVSSKCSTSSSGRRSGPSANIVVPLVDIPKDLDANKSSAPSPPTENNSKTLSPADHSLNPESCPKPMNELDEHNLEPNIEFEKLPKSSTDLPKNKESEAALKDVEVSKDSWMSITPMKITKRSISENLTSEQEAWHAEGMDTSSTLESKSVESDMKQGSGQQKYVNLSSYGSDSQSSLLSEKVRGLSHKDVSEWVKKSSAHSQFEKSPSHRHKKHKEKRRHHSSSSTSPRSNRDWERSDVGKSSKSHRSHKNDTRRIMEVSPRSKEFLKSRSVDPSEDSSDFPEADSEGTDPMKTPSKHKLLLDSSQLSKLKANFARSPLLKAKSCPSSQGTKYAPEISNSLGSYKIPKKNSTPSSGSAEHEKSTKSGHICKGSSKSENETSPDHPQNSSDSDDDLFNETPAFLREFEETSKAILNAPVMNRTADHSEIESTQSDDSFVLEEGPVQSIAVNKPDKSTFSLDALLAERVENEETERELQFMQKELKEVIKQGGFVRLAEEDVEEDDLLPEHHEKLEYFQVSVNTIQDEHPGETVLRPGRFPCVYTQTLSPLRCGFQPGSSFIETHLANIQPDALTDLLTTDMLSMCFHLIKEQEEILRWIFFIMCVHEDSCVVQGCKKLIFDIIHSQLAADESTTTWAPAVPDVLKVLVNFGGDSKELLGKQRLYSEEEIRECDCPENDADLVQGQGNMSTRSYAENIREYLQTLAFALQGRPPYSAVELNTLFLMIAKLAMEKELAQNVLLYEFTVVISSLVKCYSNEDWDAVMPGLCRELSEVTSHHHNCEYLAQLFHHDTRCTALQRRLAYLLLYKMLLPGINVNRMQIINFKLRNLAVFFPKLRDLAENDLYALYSAICLMDVAVGNERLKGQEKADLQYLMELLRTLTSDIRDNVRRLDHTRVKDLMVRISSKWTVTLQLTSSKQRNMFAWTKQKSPQKMQVQRLETGASDAESEEEDGEEKGEEEEEIVPMEEDGVIGDTNKEDEKPEEGTNEVKTAESNIKNETSKNDVDEAKQSAVDSEMSARKFEDFENLNESTSVGFVKNENLNCNNNAETEDLSQQSSGSYIEDLPIVLEVIPHLGQYEYVGMSSDDESLPELDLTLCNEL